MTMTSIADFDVGQLLGRGGFASVYRARERKTNKEVAIKICEKAQLVSLNMMERMKNEIRIHYQLKHQHVVRFYGCFEDHINVYLVLELCSMGNMFRYLRDYGPIPERIAVSLIQQLLQAVEYLHQQGVVHRDLKLSNLLLCEDEINKKLIIKICDFGLAVRKEHPDEEHYTLCGTPNYIAPEIALQQNHGYPADLWSVGCLFYSMVVGSPPFEVTPQQQQQQQQQTASTSDDKADAMRMTLRRIISGEYQEPIEKVSTHAIDFLRNLLHLNPSKRANVQQILMHPLLMNAQSKIESSVVSKVHNDEVQMHDSRDISKDSDTATALDACSSCCSGVEKHNDLSTQTVDHSNPRHNNSKQNSSIRLPTQCAEPILSSEHPKTSWSKNSEDADKQTANRGSLSSSWLTKLHSMRQSFASINTTYNAHEYQMSDSHSVIHQSVTSKHCWKTSSSNTGTIHTRKDIDIGSASIDSTLTANSTIIQQYHEDCVDGINMLGPILLSSETDELLLVTKQKKLLFCTGMRNSHKNSNSRSYVRVLIDPRYSRRVMIGRFEVVASTLRQHDSDNIPSSRYYLAEEVKALKQHARSKGSIANGKQKIFMTHDLPEYIAQLRLVLDQKQMKTIEFDTHKSFDVPKVVQSLIRRIRGILHSVQRQTPQKIIYFAHREQHGESADEDAAPSVMCKCMMMSNSPLPDFYVQWVCGVRLRYELKSGTMMIERPADVKSGLLALIWEGKIVFPSNDQRKSHKTAEEYESLVPTELADYAHQAQLMLKKCLEEEDIRTPSTQQIKKAEIQAVPKILTL